LEKETVAAVTAEIKGTCPACGGPLELRKHVICWNADGTPSESDTYNDPYCPRCRVFWLSEPC